MKKLITLFIILMFMSFIPPQVIRRAKHVEIKEIDNEQIIYSTDSAKKIITENDSIKIYLINNRIKIFTPSKDYICNYSFSKVTYAE